MSLAYDPTPILPDDLTIDFTDEALEELEWRLTTAHAMADVLARACRAPTPPRPETMAPVLTFLTEAFLEWALADVRSDRRALRYMAERRAS